MASLFLIRHGQASYGEADYDRLSTRGQEQARDQVDHAEIGTVQRGQVTVDAVRSGGDALHVMAQTLLPRQSHRLMNR